MRQGGGQIFMDGTRPTENFKKFEWRAAFLRKRMDLRLNSMPVMNGLDAALELKRLMPLVPIIMYTEFGDLYAKQHLNGKLVSKSEKASTLIHKARRLLYPVAA